MADDESLASYSPLGPQQSFPLEQMFTLLDTKVAESVLIQALLAAPMFGMRWRWNVTSRALPCCGNAPGKKVPPYLQRFRAEDLLTAAVFPIADRLF